MENFKEEWRPVVEYEGIYEVSNKGDVASLNYRKQKGIRRKLRCHIRGCYIHVSLMKNGIKKTLSVHRIVAEAFVSNPNNYPIINHKDENPLNNCAENLEWCDQKYNVNYGTAIQRRRESQMRPVIQLTKEGEFVARYKSITEATISIGANSGEISAVCSGRHISAQGFLWRFEDEKLYEKALKKRTFLENKRLINNKKANIKKSFSILQYDIYGNFIKEYPSCCIAAQELQIPQWRIRKVCYGEMKSSNGFIFKYKHKKYDTNR